MFCVYFTGTCILVLDELFNMCQLCQVDSLCCSDRLSQVIRFVCLVYQLLRYVVELPTSKCSIHFYLRL